MASMRESDTGLWLHNKLGSTDELWTPLSIASLLTVTVIDNIRLCFSSLSPPVKLKLLLGMLHLPRRTVDEVRLAASAAAHTHTHTQTRLTSEPGMLYWGGMLFISSSCVICCWHVCAACVITWLPAWDPCSCCLDHVSLQQSSAQAAVCLQPLGLS